jgi:hypothetical protein
VQPAHLRRCCWQPAAARDLLLLLLLPRRCCLCPLPLQLSRGFDSIWIKLRPLVLLMLLLEGPFYGCSFIPLQILWVDVLTVVVCVIELWVYVVSKPVEETNVAADV